MAKKRLIALNGNGGPLVAVLATQVNRRVTAREDEAAVATGIQYQTPEDAFSELHTVGTPGTPDQQQIDLCNQISIGKGASPILGLPAQSSSGAPNFRAADTLFKAQGKAAGSTTIRVTEYD